MTNKDEEKAYQEDNYFFIDEESNKPYFIDAFIVIAIICSAIALLLWEIY